MKQTLPTWSNHKKRFTDCEACNLCEKRYNIVLARGSLPAAIIFVGEAPGQSEDVLGKPFIGPAGQLLDEMIHDAEDESFDHRKVFTNLVACIPLGDDNNKLAEPSKESILSCVPRLNHLVEVAQPKAIVMVGRLSQKYCPQVIDYNFDHSLDIMHPAAILRMDLSQRGLAEQRTMIQLRDFFLKVENE